jgi:class 3 adenylate cyclase/predicted ATPase
VGNPSEAEKLKETIQTLEAQRQLLGDSVVETALAPLREKLAALQAGLGEQRKLVSVLFSDLAGFTALSSRMDPEDVREIMNAYFQRWAACIKRHQGVVEKYIGDAVLAVFGLPASHEDDPERAISAALDMQKELLELNDGFERRYGLRLSMRVGINTGEVVVSLLGERQGEEFIVVGEVVNLASRVQSAAPEGGILITHDTYRHVRGLFETSPFGPLQLKGVSHPVQAYWVKAARPRTFRLGSRGVEGVETPLVGRKEEFERLKSVFGQVLEGKDRYLAALVGEAGLGKSRLLYEFENWLDLRPERIYYFRGRAYPSTQHLPYSLLRDMFAFRCRIQDSDPPDLVREKLEENAVQVLGGGRGGQMKVHFIARLLGFEIGESEHLRPVEGDAKSLHDRALVFLGDYFRALGRAGPVVVLLEDLHWADDSSLNLIDHLETLLAGQPFLIVCAARPSLFERRPQWGEGLSLYLRLDLRPLDREASRTLVEEILKKAERIPPALIELVVNTAEGNPFYLEELIKMLIEDGVILKGEPVWRVEEERLGNLRVPPTLMGVLQARFDSLEPQGRAYLQRGAVIGRVFWDQALEALEAPGQAERDSPAATGEVLDRLRRREMIFRQDSSAFENTTEYLFKHALLRDVTYSSLLKRERRVYHSLAARWLEEVTGRTRRSAEFTMLIAEHYELAGELEQAAEWYLRAGQEAARRYANSEAVRALGRALEHARERDPRWKFTVLREREKVYELTGKREERLQDLEGMRLAAERSGDPALIAAAALRQAQYAFQTADYADAMEQARQAEGLAQSLQNLELAAQSVLLQAGITMRSGDLELSEQHARRALVLAGGQALPAIQADGYRQLGMVAYYLGNPHLAREHFSQALELYQQAGDRSGEAMALNNLGGANFNAGDYGEARSYYTRSLFLSREIGDRIGESRALNNLGITAVTEGAYAQAEEYYLESLNISRKLGQLSFEMSALDNLGNLASYRYNYSLAEKYQLESLAVAREVGDRVSESYLLVNLGGVYLILGDYERARGYVQESLDLNRHLGDRQGICHALFNLSRWCAAVEDLGSALLHCEAALKISKEADLRTEYGWALHVLGATLNKMGRYGEAAESFRQALEIRQELEERKEALVTLSNLGRAYLELGDLQKAVECSESALAQLEQEGIEGYEHPAKVFLNLYRILSAAGDPRQAQVLRQGYDLLQEIASKIESDELRRSFLERVPENRALFEAGQEAGFG